MRSVLNTVLSRYETTPTQPNILQESPAYTTTFPRSLDVPTNDKINGILNASFEAFLAGAIKVIKIEGVLRFQDVLTG